jgi:hypothetical protein
MSNIILDPSFIRVAERLKIPASLTYTSGGVSKNTGTLPGKHKESPFPLLVLEACAVLNMHMGFYPSI